MKDRKTKLYKKVSAGLIKKYTLGIYSAGDVLPSERKLAEEYGVSRTVVRESIKELVGDGYLTKKEQKHFFREMDITENTIHFEEISDDEYKLLIDLLDIRELIECYIVRKAADQATKSDIQDLQLCIDKMKDQLAKNHIDYETETSFHSILVKIANNQVLDQVFNAYKESIYDIGKYSLFVAQKSGITIIAAEEHQAILDAIEAKDADLAEKLMTNHLKYARHNILLSYRLRNEHSNIGFKLDL